MKNSAIQCQNTSILVTRKEAAEFLGVKEHTLSVWAISNRYNLPYIKVGRLVKYKMSDLEAFVEQNSRI
ncbi:MAG: helix-turn-helix domain-containing protein [Pseudomonadota bacterium]